MLRWGFTARLRYTRRARQRRRGATAEMSANSKESTKSNLDEDGATNSTGTSRPVECSTKAEGVDVEEEAQLFLRPIVLTQRTLNKNQEAHRYLIDGFYSLTMARMEMGGPARVGVLQVPKGLRADLRVGVTCEEEQIDEHMSCGAPHFEPVASTKETALAAKTSDGNDRTSLTPEDRARLRWFGGMVSPNLRHAQSQFKLGIYGGCDPVYVSLRG